MCVWNYFFVIEIMFTVFHALEVGCTVDVEGVDNFPFLSICVIHGLGSEI